jgi:hypothetical protein
MAWGGQLRILRLLELGRAQCADPSTAHSQDAMRVPRVARSRPRDAYLIADSTLMRRTVVELWRCKRGITFTVFGGISQA